MKVLVVSHNSFSKLYNNGKTLEAIFSSFDKSEISQLFFSENEYPDFDFCQEYFKITDYDVLRNCTLFNKKHGGEVVKEYSVIPTKVSDNNSNNSLFTFAKKQVRSLIVFRDILWTCGGWKTSKLFNWLEKVKPDIVFYMGGNFGFSHEIARYISKSQNIPLTVYFTDDYVINPISETVIDRIQQFRMNKFYKKTIDQSQLNFVIGTDMVNEYSKAFNKKFISIMNSVDIKAYNEKKQSKKIIVSYFGGLHLNRWKMISRLGKLLDNVQFNIYTIGDAENEILKSFEISNVKFCGAVNGDELLNKMEESDVLLHVESDDKYNRKLTKLSISTKIPEYLITGRLVLAFGPLEVSSIQLLHKEGVGLAISSEQSDLLIKEDLLKIYDYDFRRQIGKKGYLFAKQNFDRKVISDNFKSSLRSLMKK